MLLTTSRTGLCSYRQVMRACMICTAVLLGFAFAGCGQQDDHLQQGSRSGTGSTSTTGTVADDTTSAGTDEAVNAYRGPETQQVTITETVDGDSVQIQPAIEGRTDLRLVGVDTPELASARGDSGEPLAEEAATFTEGELAGEQVTLILAEDPVDPYGRLLGTIKSAEDQSTHGQNLLREGYAQTLFYEPNTQYQMLYLSTQENAKERGAGMWGLPPGEGCELVNHGNGIGSQSPECEGIGG